MKTFIALCFILLFSAALFAQPVSRSRNWDLALLPQGYQAQASSSGISSIGFNNPSFLSRFNGISAGLSYQYGFEIKNAYIGGMMGKSLVNGLPYSAALSYQAGDFHIGAAVTQKYNFRIDTGPVEETTLENPGGTGETGSLIWDRDIHDYSVISSYNINGLSGDNSLSLGLKISLGRLSYCDNNTLSRELLFPKTETSAYAMGFALGADYKIITASGDLNFGAYFEKGYDFRKFVKVELKKTVPGTDYRDYSYDPSFNLEISTPDQLRIDAGFEFSKWKVMANLSEFFWNEISEVYKNSLDLSAGAIYKTSDILSLYFGASTSDRKYSDNSPNYFHKEYNALFLSLGADLAVGSYTFGLAVSDSHLFSADTRRQTIAGFTIGYKF